MKNTLLGPRLALDVSDKVLLCVLICIGAAGDGRLRDVESLILKSKISGAFNSICGLLGEVKRLRCFPALLTYVWIGELGQYTNGTNCKIISCTSYS